MRARRREIFEPYHRASAHAARRAQKPGAHIWVAHAQHDAGVQGRVARDARRAVQPRCAFRQHRARLAARAGGWSSATTRPTRSATTSDYMFRVHAERRGTAPCGDRNPPGSDRRRPGQAEWAAHSRWLLLAHADRDVVAGTAGNRWTEPRRADRSGACRAAVRRCAELQLPPDGGEYAELQPGGTRSALRLILSARCARRVPNMQRLQSGLSAARASKCMYTVIESLTRDGRDLSLDYKISRLSCAAGSRERKVLTRSRRPTTRSCCRRPRRRCSSRPTSTTCCATRRALR